MKKIAFIILIIGFACSNPGNLAQLLTNNNWEIEKVVNLKSGKVSQIEVNHREIWEFKIDNTYYFEMKNEIQNQFSNGFWVLDGCELLIMNEFDSSKVTIEKITKNEMTWLMEGEDSIRLYLTAKNKEVSLPKFPDTSKSKHE